MYKLLSWQEEGYKSWITSGYRGTIQASTGAGKTHIGLEAIRTHPKDSILICVPTVVLQQQWSKEIKDKLNLCVGLIGGEGSSNGFNSRIVVAIINSLRNKVIKRDILIIDEVHRAGSTQNITFIKNGYFARILCLSATPHREDTDILERYAPICYKYSRGDAIKDKIISKYSVVFKSVELNDYDKMKYEAIQDYIDRNRQKGYDANSFMEMPFQLRFAYMRRKKLINNNEAKIKEAIKLIEHYSNKKVVVFSELIKTADAIEKGLEDTSHVVKYHSNMDSEDKVDAIRAFKEDKANVLISVKSLDEGMDIRNAEIGIVVSGNKVTRQTTQRLGRILRKADNKHAKLIFLYCRDTSEYSSMKKHEQELKSDASKIYWK